MGKDLVVHGKHGNKKFELELPFCSKVQDLCAEIEKETQLPVSCQRVIYNGRSLNGQPEDMKKDLGSLGLKSPAKILVLGKRPDEEDPNFKAMKPWEASCDSAEKQLTNFEKDIQDMENGFAPKQLIDEGLPKMEKKIAGLAEELMKALIALDELTFTEVQKEARAKRKVIIDRIHTLHKRCDELTSSVKRLRMK